MEKGRSPFKPNNSREHVLITQVSLLRRKEANTKHQLEAQSPLASGATGGKVNANHSGETP